MAKRMPIGHDIDLLCDAVTFAASGYVINQRNLQRRVRVGHLKAQRLLFLMDDYGVTDGPPLTRWSSRMTLITEEQLPAKLAELREIASTESEAAARG
jgi:hypothetical protein